MVATSSVHTVEVPPGPLGLILCLDDQEEHIIVKGFEELPDGSIGVCERHPRVHINSQLHRIGSFSTTNKTLQDIVQQLSQHSHESKTLYFSCPRDCSCYESVPSSSTKKVHVSSKHISSQILELHDKANSIKIKQEEKSKAEHSRLKESRKSLTRTIQAIRAAVEDVVSSEPETLTPMLRRQNSTVVFKQYTKFQRRKRTTTLEFTPEITTLAQVTSETTTELENSSDESSLPSPTSTNQTESISRSKAHDLSQLERVDCVPSDLGVEFDQDVFGRSAIIKRYKSLQSGRKGLAEQNKFIEVGFAVSMIGNVDTTMLDHREVMTLLNDKHPKVIRFSDPVGHYYESVHREHQKLLELKQSVPSSRLAYINALNMSISHMETELENIKMDYVFPSVDDYNITVAMPDVRLGLRQLWLEKMDGSLRIKATTSEKGQKNPAVSVKMFGSSEDVPMGCVCRAHKVKLHPRKPGIPALTFDVLGIETDFFFDFTAAYDRSSNEWRLLTDKPLHITNLRTKIQGGLDGPDVVTRWFTELIAKYVVRKYVIALLPKELGVYLNQAEDGITLEGVTNASGPISHEIFDTRIDGGKKLFSSTSRFNITKAFDLIGLTVPQGNMLVNIFRSNLRSIKMKTLGDLIEYITQHILSDEQRHVSLWQNLIDSYTKENLHSSNEKFNIRDVVEIVKTFSRQPIQLTLTNHIMEGGVSVKPGMSMIKDLVIRLGTESILGNSMEFSANLKKEITSWYDKIVSFVNEIAKHLYMVEMNAVGHAKGGDENGKMVVHGTNLRTSTSMYAVLASMHFLLTQFSTEMSCKQEKTISMNIAVPNRDYEDETTAMLHGTHLMDASVVGLKTTGLMNTVKLLKHIESGGDPYIPIDVNQFFMIDPSKVSSELTELFDVNMEAESFSSSGHMTKVFDEMVKLFYAFLLEDKSSAQKQGFHTLTNIVRKYISSEELSLSFGMFLKIYRHAENLMGVKFGTIESPEPALVVSTTVSILDVFDDLSTLLKIVRGRL